MSQIDFLDILGGPQAIAAISSSARDYTGFHSLGIPNVTLTVKGEKEHANNWEATLEVIEMTVIGLLEPPNRTDTQGKKRLLELCSQAFDLRRAIGLPSDPTERLKDSLRFACVAVLGQRVEDWRRWIAVHDYWPVSEFSEDGAWPTQLFGRTAESFLRLVRKNGWSDLKKIAEFISELRRDQHKYEADYLQATNGIQQVAAFELITFYHFAKAVESAAEYTGYGSPKDAHDEIELQMRYAIESADFSGVVEWAVLLRWLSAALRTLIESTLWYQLAGHNHRVTDFKRALTKDEYGWTPLFELLPPQRDAVHEVMNTSLRSIVVQMPTSGGKTLLAQFRILQTKINYPAGWIAYVVPTKALINQMTSRLRKDFGPPVNLRVELASGAEDIDTFEADLLQGDKFDVLVTTPEKLDLIIRGDRIDLDQRPLALVVMDEAQHIGDIGRGLRAELLLSTINQRSRDTAFLLLTPFIKNADEVAQWLEANPQRHQAVTPTLAADWVPNDLLVSMAWRVGAARKWTMQMESLHTSRDTVEFDDQIILEPLQIRQKPISESNTRSDVAADVARILGNRGATLVMVQRLRDSWKVAEALAARGEYALTEKRRLVKRFLESEYGPGFALNTLLDKRIGVHHAGLSDEARILVEWLMDENELDFLVATSTVAQGINFNLSNVVLSTLSVTEGSHTRPLTFDEFWNLAGRTGRVYQKPLGILAIAAPKLEQQEKAKQFVQDQLTELVSALEKLIDDLEHKGWELDLTRLSRNDQKWSAFVQYLSHCYRQIGNLSGFVAQTEKILYRTYAYQRLQREKPKAAEKLLIAVRSYGSRLSNYPSGWLTLVDSTGFSPESIQQLVSNKTDYLPRTLGAWSPSKLFKSDGAIGPIIGQLLKLKEVGLEAHAGLSHTILAQLIELWVAGEPINELARSVPQGNKDNSTHLTEVARLIFRSLSRTGSWGLNAIQSVSGINQELTPEQRRVFQSIPSMVYYGCHTVDGVLMRSQGVPRGICEGMGRRYRQDSGSPANEMAAAREWLSTQPDDVWDSARPKRRRLTGREYRQIWQIVNGHTPSFKESGVG